MNALARVRRHPVLTAFVAGVLVAAAALTIHLATRRREGDIAIDFLDALERGDLVAAARLADPEPLNDLPPIRRMAVRPTWPWHAEGIAGVYRNDSQYDYDVVVEVSSTDPEHPATAEVAFAVGGRCDMSRGSCVWTPAVLDPFVRTSASATGVPGLMAFSVGGDVLGTGVRVETGLYPGVYEVTATPPDGSPAKHAVMSVVPPWGDRRAAPEAAFTFP